MFRPLSILCKAPANGPCKALGCKCLREKGDWTLAFRGPVPFFPQAPRDRSAFVSSQPGAADEEHRGRSADIGLSVEHAPLHTKTSSPTTPWRPAKGRKPDMMR